MTEKKRLQKQERWEGRGRERERERELSLFFFWLRGRGERERLVVVCVFSLGERPKVKTFFLSRHLNILNFNNLINFLFTNFN